MTTTTSSTPPDSTRTGAVWVTGTGAFLLLAAAAVFTAVRWDQIPDAAKLAALGLATGAFLIAGRGLKATLPATAGALFHLGAFLVPIDVAAVGVRAELDWSTMLLVQGLAATATFGWAARSERSVVLRWAFAVAVVLLAGGIGATTDIPAALALAGFAVGAAAARREAFATGWAVLAGVTPLLVFVEQASLTGTGPVARLGLTGEPPRLAAALTGVVSAVVLAIAGRRRDDAGLVLVGTASAGLGVVASWTVADPGTGTTIVALCTTFLLVELTALATRHDPFWRVPTDIVAQIAEWAAGLATVVAAMTVVFALVSDGTDTHVALGALTLGAGWLAADRRRGSPGSVASAVGAATCLASAVAVGTGDDVALAVTLVAIAALAVLSGHRAGTAIAVGAAIWAPVAAYASPTTVVTVGLLGTLVLVEDAVRRSHRPMPDPHAADVAEQWTWVLSALAVVPGILAVACFIDQTGQVVAGLVGGAVAATAVAGLADRATVSGRLSLGTVPRLAALATVGIAAELPPNELATVALAVTALGALDAVRARDPHLAMGAAIAAPVAIGAVAQAADLSVAASGVVLSVSAAVLAGLGALLGRRAGLPLLTAAGLAAVSGLALAATQPSAFADAVMITSGIGMAVAVERGRLDALFVAGLTLTAGVWMRLADAEVAASEPYLLPVAALLLGAGLRARSTGTGSWVAYGPVITLLGGAALAERLTGGPGWHALVAGAVGIVAVAVGGQHRLAAPLFLGTGLLVALVGYETLAITAALPTWTWLAVGGTVLLSAGIAMERHDVGPVETGRRLVDVVDEHFA
jgi:hypothetical protein